ncbi:beta-amyrin 11-oxidase-like [Gastrolobium bilobum]|uniref:beta-amyrin 11-oxidase-like n=1 Tax=Gastrolobium bilobum TaxID=150636 RepID=UPI002AB1BA6C|nr:beta-amyrin 11-oxidase-like [Gastrolobium bilobum]
MELHWVLMSAITILGSYLFVKKFVRRLNGWYYDLKLRNKQYPLPPGDMGWPLIGNLLAFFEAFKSGHPNSFINNLVSKYGGTGIYKTHLFGNPSIIVCEPEMCWRVLTDDENFKIGYPKSMLKLLASKPLGDVSSAQHRRFRRLVTAPIVGHHTLEMYIERIEDIVIHTLEELSSVKHPVEFLKEMKKVSFKVIIHIFMSTENQNVNIKIGDLFNDMHNGLFSLPINAPGFAFHQALKARKKLVQIVQSVVEERRLMIKNGQRGDKKDLIDILLQTNGENGRKLEDEDITDLLVAFLFAGHESTATGMMWSIIYLTQHPDILKKAKEEQEEIMKTRPPSQKKLSLEEIKQMAFLSQIIDETLRRTNIVFSTFRAATSDVNVNGYIIPKGWRVLNWASTIHMDPKYYPNPEEFNPSRWDDYNAKAGTFLPFGAGSRLCPGRDLVKLEISIFLHYFLLNYKLERINPECPITNWPGPKHIDNCLAKVIKVSGA